MNKRAMSVLRGKSQAWRSRRPPSVVAQPHPARPVYAAASSLREELLRDQLRALESPH